MKIEVLSDADSVARRAAAVVAAEARAAVAARGSFVMAVSGGHTRGLCCVLSQVKMCLGTLFTWHRWTRESPRLETRAEISHTCARACSRMLLCPPSSSIRCRLNRPTWRRHARNTSRLYGRSPARRLCLISFTSDGPDGHTASLVPGEPVLEVTDADVALTGLYQGRRRMTLTYPILNRSRSVLWLATGSEKAGMLARLRAGDVSIPAGRVRRDHALVLADRATAERLDLDKDSKAEVA